MSESNEEDKGEDEDAGQEDESEGEGGEEAGDEADSGGIDASSSMPVSIDDAVAISDAVEEREYAAAAAALLRPSGQLPRRCAKPCRSAEEVARRKECKALGLPFSCTEDELQHKRADAAAAR